MKYPLLLGLITLATFASCKPAIHDKQLLMDILKILEDPNNGTPYSIINSQLITAEKGPDVEYHLEADLQDENGEVRNCPVDIQAFLSDEVYLRVNYLCPNEKFILDGPMMLKKYLSN